MIKFKNILNLFLKNCYNTNLPGWAYRLKSFFNKLKSLKSTNKECATMHKYIYGSLIAIVFVLIVSNVFFYNQNQKLNYQLALYETQLNILHNELRAQNEAIEKLALDSSEYKKQATKEKKALQAKYDKITKQLDTTQATCEQQLANINSQLNAYIGINGYE